MNKIIKIPPVISVKDLSEKIDKPVNTVITALVNFGVMANINQSIDYDTAQIIADELGVETELDDNNKTHIQVVIDEKKAVTRPPVVTIMGHVDHGKTTLLDTIRHTSVAEKEAGGITQAISSYQVETNYEGEKRKITFVDTPGHSAFEAMRQHGVTITDLVVLVVAANDGVMPQTIETIKHTKKHKVPVLVAINKIDLPDSNIEKTKRDLSEQGLVTEEWGGDTVMVEVSAKKGTGIENLLETILLQTDILDLKAEIDAVASGVVIESHMESGLGPVAVVLIQNGTLKLSDAVVIGESYGKIRLIENHVLKKLRTAGPSVPVRISGLSVVPKFGERLITVPSEKEAKEIARHNSVLNSSEILSKKSEELSKISKKIGDTSELNIFVKEDTQGSLNALTSMASNLSNDSVKITILKEAVGQISEDDIKKAASSHAIIFSFNLKTPLTIKKLADELKVTIQTFNVIYEVEKLLAKTVEDLMPEIEIEEETGKLKIIKRFNDNKKNIVVGGEVIMGKLSVEQVVHIRDKGEDVGTGKIFEIRVGQQKVGNVEAKKECGLEILVEGKTLDVKEGMNLVATKRVKVKQTI